MSGAWSVGMELRWRWWQKRGRKVKRRLRRRLRGATRPLRYALQGAAATLLLGAVARMSHERALRWGRRAGRLMAALLRRDRAIAVHNLELAFGAAMTAADRESLARRAFESMGMLAFEAAHSNRWTAEEFRSRVRLEGEEHAREAMAAGRGLLLVTGHFGNWELMPPAFFCHTGIATAVISRDVTNPALNTRMEAFRGRMGNPIFSNDRSAIAYMRLLRKGGVLAMLADQDSERLRCEPLRFFGRPARTPIGAGFLARKCGAPIVPVFIRREAGDLARHRVRFHPPVWPEVMLDEAADARRMMQAVTDRLEQEIREAPEQWAWMHDRWRRTRQWRALREEKAAARNDAARRNDVKR